MLNLARHKRPGASRLKRILALHLQSRILVLIIVRLSLVLLLGVLPRYRADDAAHFLFPTIGSKVTSSLSKNKQDKRLWQEEW